MKKISVACVGLLVAAVAGCSSSDSKSDAAVSDAQGDATSDSGVTVYHLSEHDNCFDITAVAAGGVDGCDIGFADAVGTALPVNYTRLPTSATVTVGTMGSIGEGDIAYNMATLTRNSTATDPKMDTCSWTQMDTADLTMTGDDAFTLSVTEVDSMFMPACSMVHAGGTCTSTWTWTMKKSTKTTADCL
ncbi:MAG: hypothetical protein ABJA82_06435 [Myxococcales bacterium]